MFEILTEKLYWIQLGCKLYRKMFRNKEKIKRNNKICRALKMVYDSLTQSLVWGGDFVHFLNMFEILTEKLYWIQLGCKL